MGFGAQVSSAVLTALNRSLRPRVATLLLSATGCRVDPALASELQGVAGDEATEEVEDLPPLWRRKQVEIVPLAALEESGCFALHRLPCVGEVDRIGPPVCGIAAAAHVSLGLEFVDEANHCRAVDAENIGQRLLRDRAELGEGRQYPVVAAVDFERRERLSRQTGDAGPGAHEHEAEPSRERGWKQSFRRDAGTGAHAR
jgi:hypothetical protein